MIYSVDWQDEPLHQVEASVVIRSSKCSFKSKTVVNRPCVPQFNDSIKVAIKAKSKEKSGAEMPTYKGSNALFCI